jgi:hypothetical protein
MIKSWQKFVENLENNNPIVKPIPKVFQNKIMVANLLSELEDPYHPDFMKRFGQNNSFIAKDFIEKGNPSEWYLMELIDYLKSKGVEVPDEIWK